MSDAGSFRAAGVEAFFAYVEETTWTNALSMMKNRSMDGEDVRKKLKAVLETKEHLSDCNLYGDVWKRACFEMLCECRALCSQATNDLESSLGERLPDLQQVAPFEHFKFTASQLAFARVKVRALPEFTFL